MGQQVLNLVTLWDGVDYAPSSNSAIRTNGKPIQTVWCIKTLSGNVTVTLDAKNANIGGNISNVITLPATAFTQGNMYDLNIRSVVYGNATDKTTPPLVGLY